MSNTDAEQRDQLAAILVDLRNTANSSPWCGESRSCGWERALFHVRIILNNLPEWVEP